MKKTDVLKNFITTMLQAKPLSKQNAPPGFGGAPFKM